MSPLHFQMPHRLDAVDPMVMTLASEVDACLQGEARFRFELAISEALTNLALHAKTNATEAVVDVVLTLGDTGARVDIFDPTGAAAFDIRAHAKDLAEIATEHESGRGLGLIMDCADSVTYGPLEGRNRLCLTFQARD